MIDLYLVFLALSSDLLGVVEVAVRRPHYMARQLAVLIFALSVKNCSYFVRCCGFVQAMASGSVAEEKRTEVVVILCLSRVSLGMGCRCMLDIDMAHAAAMSHHRHARMRSFYSALFAL